MSVPDKKDSINNPDEAFESTEALDIEEDEDAKYDYDPDSKSNAGGDQWMWWGHSRDEWMQQGLMVILFLFMLVNCLIGVLGDYQICPTDQEEAGTCVTKAVVSNDKYILGLLFTALAFVYGTAGSNFRFWQIFYKIIPSLFFCYFIPGIMGTCAVYVGYDHPLGGVASGYFLPATLVLLCLNVDLKGIARLGWRAIVMFLSGTLGVMFGGPFAVWFMGMVWPETVYGDETWRGLSYISGSWIGGGANAVAMADIFEPSPEALSQAIAVDIFCANIWMAILFLFAAKRDWLNKLIRADAAPVNDLMAKMNDYAEEISRIPSFIDLLNIAATGFIGCGIANGLAVVLADALGSLESDVIKFMALDSVTLWRVLLSTVIGISLSFTKIRYIEGAGASKVASVYLHFLIVTIGMGMNLLSIAENPGIFLVGFIWIFFHGLFMIGMAFLIKAPTFFICVGSQANIGGAASAPVMASAFHPALAPVGALFAVLGYIVGTVGAWACSLMMQSAASNVTL